MDLSIVFGSESSKSKVVAKYEFNFQNKTYSNAYLIPSIQTYTCSHIHSKEIKHNVNFITSLAHNSEYTNNQDL